MSIIWVGIGVDEQLQSVRERIAAVEERLALSDPCQRARMLGEPLPDTLLAERFLIGASETGALGSFRVMREIFVKSTP